MGRYTDLQIPIDNTIVRELNFAVKRLMKKWDCVWIFDGGEGVGKSTHAMTCGYYMTYRMNEKYHIKRRFSLKNVVFTPQQFEQAVKTLKDINVIVWDEMGLAGSSADAMTSMQSTLIKLFTTIRKKRFFIILIIPYIFQLRKYFATSRADLLIHHYTPDNYNRGYWEMFSKVRMKKLYQDGKRRYDSYCVKGETKGTFSNTWGFFFDEEEYDLKKEEAIQQIGKPERSNSETVTNQTKQRNSLIKMLYDNYSTGNEGKPKTMAGFVRYLNKQIPDQKFTSNIITKAIKENVEP